MEYDMGPDLSTYDKQSVVSMFEKLVARVTPEGIGEFMDGHVYGREVGIDAIQTQHGASAVTANDLQMLPGELILSFLNEYVRPVVTAEELQYLFPDRVGDGEALFSTLAMLICESQRLIKGFKPFEFKNVDSVFTLETTITGKDGAAYVAKGSELRLPKPKKSGDAPHWRRMQIEFSRDSMFHQRVRQWATGALPYIIYATFEIDASAKAGKRRIERDEATARAKRARSGGSAAGSGVAMATGGGGIASPVIHVQAPSNPAERRREAAERNEANPDRVDVIFESKIASRHLEDGFSVRDDPKFSIETRLDATMALDSSVPDFARLQRVVILGTQGDNSRGGPGKEIRFQSDAYEQRIADYIQTYIVKTATTKLGIVAPLARRIRHHDMKLFMSAGHEMDILFGFDDGIIKDLRASEQLTAVYIPNAIRILALLGHEVMASLFALILRHSTISTL